MLARLPATETRVANVMTSPVKWVRDTETVDSCMRIMTDLRIRHLPVLEGDRVAGMISVGDLVKAQLKEKESLIHDLESYIAGSPSARPPMM
ncbi:MAG TPA: CBS domain-containing protein, partial [Polyangiales bacterium]